MQPGGPNQPASDLPAYLFFYLSAQDFEAGRTPDDLILPEGRPLRLYAEEEQVERGGAPATDVGVIEAGRASRNEVVFTPVGEGVYEAERVPLRFVLSLRRTYERQVSAGGVLARGRGEEVEFALMRTLPRAEAVAKARSESEEGEFIDPRGGGDRRNTDRRGGPGPPDGKERRRGRSRRMRRRRRSSRWGPNGRLELPKGKLEPGETTKEAALREVREELGLTGPVEVGQVLSKNHYTFRTPDGKSIFKTVHYYLLLCGEEAPEFTPRTEEGIVSVEWWSGQRAIQQVAFPSLKPVLERAWDLLQD